MRGLRAVSVLLVLAGLAAAAAASAPPSLERRLSASLMGPGVSLARTAAFAIDVGSGEVIFSHNESLPVIPASNEKLPVTWTALLRLGPSFRFHTEVVGVGRRVGQVWDGDIYLKGYGDPTLAADDVAQLVRTLRQRGIRRITGDVRGDESFFDNRRGAPGWKSSFVGIETPPLSALALDRARGWPALSPPLLAARALRDALTAARVVIDGRPRLGIAPAGARLLATAYSEPLSRVIALANRESDNFVAEMLLKRLGAVSGRTGTTARGAAVVMQTMAANRISTVGVRIVDGSGLSRLDRLTASALVGVLQAGLSNPEIRAPFLGSLAVAGRSGTMRNRLFELQGRLRGKTGTTNLACSLSGLVDKRIAFSVLENGDPVSFWASRSAQDRFVTQLATLG